MSRLIMTLLALASLSLLSACGETTEITGAPSSVVNNNTTNFPSFPVTPTPAPSPSPTTGFMPAYTYSFSITGAGGTKETQTMGTIQTDNKLVVRVKAGPSSQLSVPGVYSNFTANYACVSYTITVLGRTVVTNTLSVPGGDNVLSLCPGAPTEQIIDFSDRLGPGHPPVSITVSAPRYDFYCQLWYRGWVYGDYYMFCPQRTVYKNHTVTGSLDIQVNGTTL